LNSNHGLVIGTMETLFSFKRGHTSSSNDELTSWDEKIITDTNTDMCPYCKGTDCFDQDEYVSCMSCGNVLYRAFDNTAEYRYFAQEDRGGDPTRVGAPQDPSLPQASLGTLILGGTGNMKNMYKVRKYHSWNTVPYKERSLIQTYERLNLIGLNNGINNSAIENARNMYITIQDINGRQGLSRDAILSACMYMSLKDSGSPRKPKEVAEMFGLSSATFTKALKQIQEILALARQKGKFNSTTKAKSASTKAIEYIRLPLSRLPLSRTQMEHLSVLSERIAIRAEEEGLSQENMPPSLAAGCVAFVLKRCDAVDIPISKIAEASEISLATLQKCLRRLESNAEALEECLK
jgi:transcription initiation factor TFIIIB Brf1 subunit/transcription initiation factor TFIIB